MPWVRRVRRPWYTVVLLALVLCAVSQTAFALDPDEIALVVNSNVPDGVELAKFYARQRHIPDNRILVLDLPKSDSMPSRLYEDQVVPQIRDFLRTGHLEGKLKCLVSFYGVPLRIDARSNTPDEDVELADIRQQKAALPEQIRPSIQSIEALAKELNPNFVPDALADADHLLKRRVAAFKEVSNQLRTIGDKNRQAQVAERFFDLAQPLLGETAEINRLAVKMESHAPATAPEDADRKALGDASRKFTEIKVEASELENTPNDAGARAKLREIARTKFGLLALYQLLEDQEDYLQTDQTGAAFDNELAMVEWKAYRHKSFLTNPLHYGYNAPNQWQTLMVTRLDAPTSDIVKAMITTSIKVEQEGLTGQLVVDSRGIKPGQDDPEHPGFGLYDQYLRNLANLARQKTKLTVLFDEKMDVLPPGSADHVAMYCGWYSVHNYVASCKFNPGAVGFHIASYELLTLRGAGDNGWVRGLLNDGVVGTLGPVAEPYLGTFPRPDDFFPLLMTGKLTLAEVYWKSEPTVSWMMDCVGDPLYNPYKNNAPLKVSDLPDRLRPIFTLATGKGSAPFGMPGQK